MPKFVFATDHSSVLLRIAMGTSNWYFFVMTGGLMVCGTFNSLIAKLIYGLKSEGVHHLVHNFEKPWFQTTNMFLGMLLCLPLFYAKTVMMARMHGRDEENKPLLPGSPTSPLSDDSKSQSIHAVIAATAVADLAATGLMMTGLVFTTPSVYQMLRGAEVVFVAALSILFLKSHLDQHMRMGIVITVVGITLVGVASCVGDSGTAQGSYSLGMQVLGIVLILLAQLVAAVQQVAEEFLLQDVRMDALELAGYEGLWGGLLCVAVFLPLFYLLPGGDQGRLEDSYDSLLMLYNSRMIVLAEVLNCLSVLSYNYFGLTVTQDFTAMHRVIIEASRHHPLSLSLSLSLSLPVSFCVCACACVAHGRVIMCDGQLPPCQFFLTLHRAGFEPAMSLHSEIMSHGPFVPPATDASDR